MLADTKKLSIEEAIRQIDIIKELSSYIDLKRSGVNYIGKCPFHDDSTPSLSVSEQRHMWKCFGCGKGGDVVKFVSLYENITYQEALQKLSIKYNLPINIKIEDVDKNKHIYKVMSLVSSFYQNELIKHNEALSYLKNRFINAKIIEEFEIGYSPNHYALVDFLRKNSDNYFEIYKNTQNLSVSNTVRDIFSNRIVFPIKDGTGNVVGFGGRILDKDVSSVKYLNSPDSDIFKKSNLLFGFSLAIPYIKESKEVILVEGYFDVIRLYQIGIRNVVAPLGTSFTQEQAKILSRYVNKAYVFFDNDNAGKNASLKVANYLLSHNIDTFYVDMGFYEGVKDPDEFGIKFGKDGVLELLSKAKDFMDVAINAKNIELSLRLLSCVTNPQKLYEYTEKLVSIGVAKDIINQYVLKNRPKEPSSAKEILDLPMKDRITLKALYVFGVNINPLDFDWIDKNSIILAEKLKNRQSLTDKEQEILDSVNFPEDKLAKHLEDILKEKKDIHPTELLNIQNTLVRKVKLSKTFFSSYTK